MTGGREQLVTGESAEPIESSRKIYGCELILDLHGCDARLFTRAAIEQFCEELCVLIDMERCDLHFWDDLDVPGG